MSVFATNDDYIREYGQYCPVCCTDDISDDEGTEAFGNTVLIERSCNNCDASWKMQFTLTGYTELETSETEED